MPVPSDFLACRAWLKQPGIEGELSTDSHDPGGRTFEGIEQREYDAWCYLHGSHTDDVAKAAPDTITAIYQVQYWQPYCPLLPAGANLVFFDINVNQGQHFAVTALQQALGIEADGKFGLVTAAHVKNMNQPGFRTSAEVIHFMTDMRIHRYRGTRNFEREGKGWLSRADRCQILALQMAGVSLDGVQPAANVVA